MNICIIVPCYNEADRIPLTVFETFLSHSTKTEIYFVNDGSTDTTSEALNKFRLQHTRQVELIDLEKNFGKGNAVREGIQNAIENSDCNTFAYLDADLSTSLYECVHLAELIDKNTEFVFGSRIKKIDNTIKRKWFRFIVGRIIATAISKALSLAVYDTQCGCKLFTRNTAQIAFKTSFISPWLFDVEIFFRLKNYFGIRVFKTKSAEIPLKNWRDQGRSKIQWTYGFKMWFDLLKIKRAYN